MTAKKKRSDFDIWFEGQAGKCPSKKSEPALALEVAKVRNKLHELENTLQDLRDYNTRRTYASYAWNARGWQSETSETTQDSNKIC
jgi:hypothetical protein